MSAPTYTNVIASLSNQIDVLTSSFTFNGYNALASYLAIPLGSACILYFTLLGLSITLGYVEGDLKHLTHSAVKIGLIYMGAMSWGYFSEYLVALFETAASEIGAVLLQADPLQGSMTSTDLNSALQSTLTQVVNMGLSSVKQGSLRHLMPYLYACLEWGFGFAAIALCFIELIAAKVMLSIILCVAPLFISFALFKETKTFFEKWLGAVTGFSFVLILVSAATALALSLLTWSIGSDDAPNTVGWVPLALTAILSMTAVLQVTSIAKAIGGACSTSHGAAMMSAFIGGALGAGLSPLNRFNRMRQNRGSQKQRAKENKQLAGDIASNVSREMKKGTL